MTNLPLEKTFRGGGGVNEEEGVNDEEVHTFRYAYRLHDGRAQLGEIERAAEEFNRPFIVTQRTGETVQVTLPFLER
jgi:alpha-mannosidase